MSTGAAAPGALFETADRGLLARCETGRGSGILAVVFSQVRVPAGRFGLSRLFARTRHACLFVNQPSGAWYRGAAQAVDEAIRRAIDATGAGRVVLYGSSMGGWGALEAAARWPRAEAIAFAPDVRIGEPGSRSAEAGLAPLAGEPTLADLLARRGAARTDVVIGLFDPYDAGAFARLSTAGIPAVRFIPARSGHEVHDHLYTVNVVRRIISTFGRDVAASIGERGLLHPAVDPGALVRFAALQEDLRAGRPVHPAAVAGLGLAGNPGAAMLEAEALERSGDPAGAEAVLARMQAEVEASPELITLPTRFRKRIPLARIRLLRLLGRTGDAERLRAGAAAAYPGDDRFAGSGSPGPGFGQQG